MLPLDPTAALRRSVYTLLIVTATFMALGRVLAVIRVYEPDLHRENDKNPQNVRPDWPTVRPAPTPMFGSNDRSRWATVRALVDEGTYVIGSRDATVTKASAVVPLAATDPFLSLAVLQTASYQGRVNSDWGIVFEDGWQTIDRVLHPERQEFYSSKPPLLATLVAGEYWLVKKVTGWNLRDNPFSVVRLMLVTINVLPFALYLWLLSRLAETFGRTDWGRLVMVTVGAFGTLITPFVVTFNNHSIAVVTTLCALAVVLHLWTTVSASRGWYVLAGLLAGFTATNELPALALVAALGLVLATRSLSRTLLLYGPAAAVPLVALLFTNYLALGQLGFAYDQFGGPWYQYEGSIWRDKPWLTNRGIDWAREHETRLDYAFHLLLGHHGLFSLTPVFLFSFWALVTRCFAMQAPSNPEGSEEPLPTRLPWLFFPVVLGLSLVVIAFYLVKSDNYGGVSPGPRWLLWLTPLWLVAMLPVLDLLEPRRWGRALALVFLALSVLSASFPAWNPWRMPWIYRWLDSQGLIPY
jgi:hypothetical protein